MAGRQKTPKPNRYKKSGKGATILAVFIIGIMAVLVGAYYFFAWQTESDEKKKPVSVVVRPDAIHKVPPLAPPVSQQPTAAVVQQEPVPKPSGPQWEHYTADTSGEESIAKPKPGKQTPSHNAELAIIVDDMGTSIHEAQSLAAIGVPLTMAVIPGLRQYKEVAAFASTNGMEVMLHIPMQPKEYPKRRLEQNGLLLSHDDEEIKTRFQQYITEIPQAVGANNHMGSGFTEDSGKMRLVLGMLKQKGFFYIDSITTPSTVGPRLTKELGVRGGRRDVFLDNEQDETYIRGQLAKAVERARKTGHAIAICHPHPTTISTLAKTLPALQKEGIKFVYASKAVK